MTAEEALRQAKVEGLTLLRSGASSTGYKGVSFDRKMKTSPYFAQVRRGGNKTVILGYFATVEEAALCYARTPEAQAAVAAAAAPPAPPPLTAEEAMRQAEAEGLALLKSESSSAGFKGVCFKSGRPKPYYAQVCRDGTAVTLGKFATAEEAALAYARTPEAQASVAVAAAPPAPSPMTAEEALRQAEAEGVTLLKSESSNTGYKNVGFRSDRPKPYKAQVRRGGKPVILGYFATAEEAALCYARTPEAQAAVAAAAEPPPPPPLTTEEALRQAEAKGLTLLRVEDSITGFKGVTFNSGRPKPYKAQATRGGKQVTLGYFATAEEAALCYARDAAAHAAAPKPPASSSRKRKVKSEEQPPDMPVGARVKLEEQPPPMPNDAVVKLELSCD